MALVLLASLCAGPALAGSSSGGNDLDGSVHSACGNWVLKLHDFGKDRVKPYDWVPDSIIAKKERDRVDELVMMGLSQEEAEDRARQETRRLLEVKTTFVFGFPPPFGNGPGTYAMSAVYPDQIGDAQQIVFTGTYKQKGDKLKFEVDEIPDDIDPADTGIDQMEVLFRTLSENNLFGERDLVTELPYAEVRNSNDLRFKGRIKKNDRLKVKFKATMRYDIQYITNSEFPDAFNLKGRWKLRADTKKCRNPLPPISIPVP